MKTKIIIPLLALLFIAGDFIGGCEEEEQKPDYISVNINLQGWLNQADSLNAPPQTWECSEVCKSHQVKVKIQKDQGEFVEEIKVTNDQCSFNLSASFQLYREQPIEMWARSNNDIPGYSEYGGYRILTWNDVYPAYDFGDTYNHYQPIEIFLVPE
jgi:hypothetical protein